MKKLFILIITTMAFVSCEPDTPPNKLSTVIVERIGGEKDTVNIQYFKLLKIYSNGDLTDDNGNVLCSDVRSFSLLKTEETK